MHDEVFHKWRNGGKKFCELAMHDWGFVCEIRFARAGLSGKLRGY